MPPHPKCGKMWANVDGEMEMMLNVGGVFDCACVFELLL
jgi:hypothetical protein